jgi:hypothetical protein
MNRDLVLFTGEKIRTNAGRRHMMGEEGSRILHKLKMDNPKVNTVIREADEGITQRIKNSGSSMGRYCCKTCSCSLWLNVSAGGLNKDVQILKAGLEFLKQHREDKGTWKGFPYFYTLYVLNEIDTDLAKEELQFASRSILRWIKRKPQEDTKYTLRRHFIGNAILNKIH